jgi:hypothetical protein
MSRVFGPFRGSGWEFLVEIDSQKLGQVTRNIAGRSLPRTVLIFWFSCIKRSREGLAVFD